MCGFRRQSYKGSREWIGYTAIKNTILKQPIKALAKELSKLVPFLGQAVAPSISVVILEAAGWNLAKKLESKFKTEAN